MFDKYFQKKIKIVRISLFLYCSNVKINYMNIKFKNTTIGRSVSKILIKHGTIIISLVTYKYIHILIRYFCIIDEFNIR